MLERLAKRKISNRPFSVYSLVKLTKLFFFLISIKKNMQTVTLLMFTQNLIMLKPSQTFSVDTEQIFLTLGKWTEKKIIKTSLIIHNTK